MVNCFDRIAVQMTEIALEPVKQLRARSLLSAVTLRTTDQRGLVLDGFTIKVPEARIGKLRIAAVEVVYESDPDVFTGSAQVKLPPAYGSPLTVSVTPVIDFVPAVKTPPPGRSGAG